MNITINTKDGVPIYRQIANQIRYMVASETAKAGRGDNRSPHARAGIERNAKHGSESL